MIIKKHSGERLVADTLKPFWNCSRHFSVNWIVTVFRELISSILQGHLYFIPHLAKPSVIYKTRTKVKTKIIHSQLHIC